tara:strand:+ start:219 stop:2129 length:1911 start_codon:yes stop_codon:yes gene_type:complete
MTIKTQRLLARAKKIEKKGDTAEAQNIYLLILKNFPKNQEAKNGLLRLKETRIIKEPNQKIVQSIVNLYAEGQSKKALVEINPVIKDFPNSPLLFNIRASCYKAIGKLNEASMDYENALLLKPDYAEVHYNLGVTLRELGKFDAAINSYKKALGIKHDYPGAHNNLGNIFLELRNLKDAANHFEWAIAFQPNFAEAYNNLGVTEKELGLFQKSIKNFEKAIEIDSNYVDAHSNLGNMFQTINKLDNAIECHKRALAINPSYTQSHLNLGNIHLEKGEIDDAIKSYEKSLSINPNYAFAYYNLTEIKKYTITEAQIDKMKSLFSDVGLNASDRIHICFALAKVNERLGNKKELFKFLHEGNRLRKLELNYSASKSEILIPTVKKIFSSPIPKIKDSTIKDSSIRPIFILGMPRSGSTLVEQIISSHRGVYGAGELSTLPTIISPFAKNYLQNDENNLSEEILLSIRSQYLNELTSFRKPEKVITDKLPLNFQYIGFILSAFPEAKIIHMKRDARAVCWSIYKSNFRNNGNGFAYNLNDLADFYLSYKGLMNFWHKTFPNKIYDMCYEDLTTHQEEETRKLLEYCQLEWDQNCLNFHNSKRAVKTASSLQVRQKMYKGSSEAWKIYEDYLGPLIKALN